jgi:hypothetical protein
MSAWDYGIEIGVALVFTVFLWSQRRRSAAIRALANRTGFHYLGRALPPFLSGFATSTWNLIEGERHGIRVVAFDCKIGAGKGGLRRTVVAAETTRDVFDGARFNTALTVRRLGSWMILWQPGAMSFIPAGLMSVAELESHLNAIGP